MIKNKLCLVILVSSICVAQNSSALVIQLNDIGGAAPGTAAGNGFLAAAQKWSSVLSDPITVRLNVGFTTLSSGVLGSTSASYQVASYSSIRNALLKDKKSNTDMIAVQNLWIKDDLSFISNNARGTIALDNDASNNNRFLNVTTANLKALNLLNDSGTSDATIQFSNLFNFDFNPANGIAANAFDFISVAVHEIGHALGFVSGVDSMDAFSKDGPGAPQNINFNQYAIYSVLDLYRYSAQSTAIGKGVQDLAIGNRGQYFSLDGGKTSTALFSTGSYNGDGRQASHWKDNLNVGLLDPTLGYGELGAVSAIDLLAMDTIGFDVVPPTKQPPRSGTADTVSVSLPSSLACFLLGAYGIVRLRRKYRHQYAGHPH
ncbi:MAG: NF038122 family metalloprotease [Gammaproteobacteria bacterium]